MNRKIYLIISLYNKELEINNLNNRLSNLYDRLIKEEIIHKESKIILINNGSLDDTYNSIINNCKNNYYIHLNTIKYDVEDSLLLGLYEFINDYDLAICIDYDNINELNIDKIIEEYDNGYDIVYETKKYQNNWKYRLLKKLKIKKIIGFNNYFLINNKMASFLKNNKQLTINLTEFIPLLNFKQKEIQTDKIYKLEKKKLTNTIIKNTNIIPNTIKYISIINLILSIITFIILIILYFIINISILLLFISIIWIVLSLNLINISILINKKNDLKINYYVVDNSKENSIL